MVLFERTTPPALGAPRASTNIPWAPEPERVLSAMTEPLPPVAGVTISMPSPECSAGVLCAITLVWSKGPSAWIPRALPVAVIVLPVTKVSAANIPRQAECGADHLHFSPAGYIGSWENVMLRKCSHYWVTRWPIQNGSKHLKTVAVPGPSTLWTAMLD